MTDLGSRTAFGNSDGQIDLGGVQMQGSPFMRTMIVPLC